MTSSRPDSAGWFTRTAERVLRTRWMVRAPIGLFRAGLGFLFGGRLILLEHIGRTSGLTRYVVLEVVARPAPGSFVVASGFGTRAQWYQNVVAHPTVRVRWSARPAAAAVATPVAAADAASIIAAYAEQHPRAWARLSPVFEATLGAPLDDPGSLPLVRLDVRAQGAKGGRIV